MAVTFFNSATKNRTQSFFHWPRKTWALDAQAIKLLRREAVKRWSERLGSCPFQSWRIVGGGKKRVGCRSEKHWDTPWGLGGGCTGTTSEAPHTQQPGREQPQDSWGDSVVFLIRKLEDWLQVFQSSLCCYVIAQPGLRQLCNEMTPPTGLARESFRPWLSRHRCF